MKTSATPARPCPTSSSRRSRARCFVRSPPSSCPAPTIARSARCRSTIRSCRAAQPPRCRCRRRRIVATRELLAFAQVLRLPRVTISRRRGDAGDPVAASPFVERLRSALAEVRMADGAPGDLRAWRDPRGERRLAAEPVRPTAPAVPADALPAAAVRQRVRGLARLPVSLLRRARPASARARRARRRGREARLRHLAARRARRIPSRARRAARRRRRRGASARDRRRACAPRWASTRPRSCPTTPASRASCRATSSGCTTASAGLALAERRKRGAPRAARARRASSCTAASIASTAATARTARRSSSSTTRPAAPRS